MKKILGNRTLQLTLVLLAGFMLGWLIFNRDPAHTHIHDSEVAEESVWTCSMHPQIRQSDPGNCPLCGMSLIPLISSPKTEADHSPYVFTMSPEAIALANIQTSRVKFSQPEFEISLNGRIAVNEQKLSVISASYAGRIENLFIDFTGQFVQKGEKLATIYSPELVSAQRELLEAAKHKQRNPALYEAAKEKLRLLRVPEKQVQMIEESGGIITEFDVYAGVSGVVRTRNVSRGDYVSRGSVMFEIADLSSVWVVLDAYETDMRLLKTGGKVSFRLASLANRQFSSTITFIDPVVNAQTRTVRVRAEANNPGLELKPDMFVSATVRTTSNSREEVLLIPVSSLLWSGRRSIVYVRLPETETPSFEMREIALGARIGDFYIVENGLKPNEEVVTNGVFMLDAAAQLSGNFSMMQRPLSKRITVPERFKQQLTQFLLDYFDFKNSLVESDSRKALTIVQKLIQSFNAIDMNLLDEAVHLKWMEVYQPIHESLRLLSQTGDLDEQRSLFNGLSDAVIKAVEMFGVQIDVVFLAYCPMAFNDTGAYWLSEFSDIKNPYFGEMMLRCGEVKKEFTREVSYSLPTTAGSHTGHQH